MYVKSFLSLKVHWAALIFISIALSQTPVYTARPWIWGQCITSCACLSPSFSLVLIALIHGVQTPGQAELTLKGNCKYPKGWYFNTNEI